MKTKLKTNKGITLIALVITIIVLLILAGVSIAMLTGENGLLTKANDAKQATEKAGAKEAVQMEVAGSFTNDGIYSKDLAKTNIKTNLKNPQATVTDNGDGSLDVTYKGVELTVKPNGEVVYKGEGGVPSEVTPGTIVKGENKQYTKNGTAVIPKGFAIVPGCDDVSQGLVISDNANDTELDPNSKISEGNQFVWIPVTDMSKFVRQEGYSSGSPQNMLSICGEADATGENTTVEESATTKSEAKAMYKSVQNNKGFYIGRYEAGVDQERTSNTTSLPKVIVKKNKPVYNYIGWSNKNDMNVDTGGAVQVARNMYTDINTYGVTSTLCYGVQWDAALRFIDPDYTGYARDSSKQGWYYDNYNKDNTGANNTNPTQQTGIDLIYKNDNGNITNKKNNIYDMAGNVCEWTMESYNTDARVKRGGYCSYSGSYLPSSTRNSSPPYSIGTIGFRVTLYV